MFIPVLTSHCFYKYRHKEQCQGCPYTCTKICGDCLGAIHLKKIRRNYDCDNLIYFYVCKYIYKYSSEIEYVQYLLTHLYIRSNINIISIGCGPCTELAGILNFLKKRENIIPIQFFGFEANGLWKPVHDTITEILKEYYPFVTPHFNYGDAQIQIKNHNMDLYKPHMLILNYLISDLVRNQIDTSAFLQVLNSSIISFMTPNSYLLLNDINHNKEARNYFEIFEKLINSNYHTNVIRMHFTNNNKPDYIHYGSQHPNNILTTSILPIIQSTFNPWEFCSSAQMIIHKKN